MYLLLISLTQINSPYESTMPASFYFIYTSTYLSSTTSHANKGALWEQMYVSCGRLTCRCDASATADQAYLRPTHGTPEVPHPMTNLIVVPPPLW